MSADPHQAEHEALRVSARGWIASRSDFFDARRPVLVARAPGRLDVMGGIADYSGSLVLELPLAVATWVAVQAQERLELVIESTDAGAGGRHVTIPLEDIVPAAPLPYAEAQARLTRDPDRAWAAYVAGALVLLHHEHRHRPRHGAKVLIRSDVPIGKGVSSSAALEVAALEAFAALEGVGIVERTLALAAQTVENLIVGAPCGVMDQMTAAWGEKGHLLELLCQPAKVVGHLALPPELELFGIDSGIRHAVSGSDYRTVRAAAFMGYRIVADAAGMTAKTLAPGHVIIEDQLFADPRAELPIGPFNVGYLANITPEQWEERYEHAVPERMTGKEFLARFGGSTDTATTIEEARTYPVRAATAFPIYENDRARIFASTVREPRATLESTQESLGRLMYQSHAGYSACGLGADGTDRLVNLCRAAGPAAGIYGAKITGGGSGGTVAVLAAASARPAIDEIARAYRQETGRDAQIFAGSSSGSRLFGVYTIEPA